MVLGDVLNVSENGDILKNIRKVVLMCLCTLLPDAVLSVSEFINQLLLYSLRKIPN